MYIIENITLQINGGQSTYKLNTCSSPEDVFKIAKTLKLNIRDRESLWVIGLNSQNQITYLEEVSKVTADSSIAHPREIFKSAIIKNANAIIIFHNHPSGSLNFSKEDSDFITRISEAGTIIGIELFDFLIVTKDYYVSGKENELL